MVLASDFSFCLGWNADLVFHGGPALIMWISKTPWVRSGMAEQQDGKELGSVNDLMEQSCLFILDGYYSEK